MRRVCRFTLPRPRLLALALVLAVLVPSCGLSDSDPNASPITLGRNEALRFEQSGAVRVSPAARLPLVLLGRSGEPARIWLEGDYLDASLDHGASELEDGRADIRLSAPSTPTTFAIRARQGDATTRLEVSVNRSGSATLRVRPKYNGPRPATSVVASVFVSRTCDELTAAAIADGPAPVEGPPNQLLELPSVPVQVPLAVLARIERYAVGCARIDPLQADATQEIDVILYDRPVNLAATFAIDFDIAAGPPEMASWHAALAPLAVNWVAAFLPVATDEGKWLLDAMTEDLGARVSPAAATQFSSNRAGGGWNATTTAWLAAHAPSVRTRATGLVDAGIAKPPTPLSLTLRPSAQLTDQALVAVTALANRAVSGAWVSSPAPFDWKADATDILSLAGGLTFEPGTLIGFGADVAAAPSVDAATVIAQGVDCAGLAQALIGSGTSSSGCGLACTADLCRSALSLRARTASAAIDALPGALSLGIAGSAKPRIGADANIVDLAGTCYFSATLGAAPFSLTGSLAGKPAP